MRKMISVLCLLSIAFMSFGQKKAQSIVEKDLATLSQLEDSIAVYGRIAVTDSILDRRLAAQSKLLPTLKQALAIPNAFNYAFDKIENISIQYPQDNAFRIFTWQLKIDEINYQYFGIIQVNASKSIIYELKDMAKSIQKPEGQILSKDKWFGALYYTIRDFKTKEGTKYLLFGFNANDTIEKIKLCDVLTLRGGQVKFGSAIFQKEERGRIKTVNRLMLYHSVESSIRFNYDDEMGMIVHDHLEDIGNGQNIVGVPDGTYEAYKLTKGNWEHIKQLATTVMDDAPVPKPVLGKKAKVVDKENAKKFEWVGEEKKGGN